MQVFISYKFTGEPYEQLVKNIGVIEHQLTQFGHSVYSSLKDEKWFQENKPTNKDILFHTIDKLDNSDTVLIFLNSNEKSEGMLIEIGYAIAKQKKIVLLVRKEIETNYLRDIADVVIEFENIRELESKEVKIKI
jgi:nucleoside 2-deoxyribosyltransferase